MTKVTITGWREGLNKVQLNGLLRSHAGYGLAEAKHAIDTLLSGADVAIGFPDPGSAAAFRRSAAAIGADCRDESKASVDNLSPSRSTRPA